MKIVVEIDIKNTGVVGEYVKTLKKVRGSQYLSPYERLMVSEAIGVFGVIKKEVDKLK